MLRRVMEGVILIILCLMVISVQAQAQFCWTMTPFIDELSIIAVQPDPAVGTYQLSTVIWDGAGVYTLEGAGEADHMVTPGGVVRAVFTVKLHNPYEFEGFFGGNAVGSLHASIGLPPQPLNGPYTSVFIGSNSVPFTHTGILVEHPCGGVGEVVAMNPLSREEPLLAGLTPSGFMPMPGR